MGLKVAYGYRANDGSGYGEIEVTTDGYGHDRGDGSGWGTGESERNPGGINGCYGLGYTRGHRAGGGFGVGFGYGDGSGEGPSIADVY